MNPPNPLPESPRTAQEARARLLERLQSGDLDLPMLPETAAQVVELARDDTTGAMRLAELIERDPALAAHTLRMANSAAYAPPAPIVSLPMAITRLGFRTVSEIATSIALRGRVFTVTRHSGLIRGVWAHSATAGAWAREIGRLRRHNVEGAFLCGLLHDVGKPVILQQISQLEESWRSGFPAEDVIDVLERLHPRIGASLISRWELPDWMADAVAYHHDYASAPAHRDEAMTTALASALAHWTLESPPDQVEALRALPVVGDLNLYPEDLDQLLLARERVVELTAVMA